MTSVRWYHSLRFDGRKRVHQGDHLMARIVADRLIKHLERGGFVVMKKPTAPAHSAPPYRYRRDYQHVQRLRQPHPIPRLR